MVRRVNPALVSLWLVFFLNGSVLSSWAPRIPDVKQSLNISDGALGIALFGVAAGSVPALFATGALLRRVPGRLVCGASAAAFAAALPLIALARDGAGLTAALAVLGAASGCLDVTMNTVGIRYERQSRTRVLSRLHGGYSFGVLAGGASGAFAAHLGIPVGAQFGATAALLSCTALAVARALPPDTADRGGPTTPAVRRGRVSRLPLPVATLAVAALLMEGMIFDWSALLVARDYGGGTSLGAFTVAAFSCAMFLSRSAGDAIVDRIGVNRLVVIGSAGFAVAMLVGLAQPSPAGVLIAITITSLALGPLFPLAVSAAGRGAPAEAAAMTALVSAVGYLAYLGGPPLVGMGAELLSLPATVALVTVACAVAIACGGRKLRRAHVRDDTDHETRHDSEHVGGGTRSW